MTTVEAKSTPIVTRKAPPTPAPLRSEAVLRVQTRQAQKLVNGRDGNVASPIIGLLSFGNRMRMLWQAAEHDDPYADWFLIQIEKSIEDARVLIQDKVKNLRGVLNAMENVRVDLASSLEPIEVPLQFSNPYGYMGAYLIADYDDLARAVLTGRHVAVIDRDKSQEILNGAGRAIRRTFQLVTGWRYTGVIREDLRQMNQAAARAKELMGELPQDVAEGKRRARHAPSIRPRPASDQAAAEPADQALPGWTANKIAKKEAKEIAT